MSDLLKGMADATLTGQGGVTPTGARLIREARGYDRDPVRYGRRRRILFTSLGIIVPLALVLLWEAAARNGWIDRRLYPSPSDCWDRMFLLFREKDFKYDLQLTLKRMLVGWFWGCVIGLLFSYLMGMSAIVRAALEPLLNMLYTVPKLALISPFLIIFGFKDRPLYILIAITVFFFVWVPTQASVLSVSESFREAATSFGSSRWQLFRHVIWPSTLPGLFVTLRVAASVAVLSVIGVEIAYAPQSRGLGFQINNARNTLELKTAYTGIVFAALIGVIFQWLVKRVGRLVVRWEKEDRGAPVV
jgi:sulfonate transport system permease protein